MKSHTIIKICGLSQPLDVQTALDCHADMLGFVFYHTSPRNVTPLHARALCANWTTGAKKVALVVNADDVLLDLIISAMAPDILQLHGGETPGRVREIRQKFGLPVMKALGISAHDDLERAQDYADCADWLLFDAKPPRSADRPGGNGLTFDWQLLSGFASACPWLLSGGLDSGNVAEALRIAGARGVDVSSGVESAPGVKDVNRIRSFIHAVRHSSH